MNSLFFITAPVSRHPWETRGQTLKKKNSKTKDRTMAVYCLYFPVESSLRQQRQNDLNHHRFVLVWSSFWKYTMQPLKSAQTQDSAPHSSALLALHPLKFTVLLLDLLVPSGSLLWPGKHSSSQPPGKCICQFGKTLVPCMACWHVSHHCLSGRQDRWVWESWCLLSQLFGVFSSWLPDVDTGQAAELC